MPLVGLWGVMVTGCDRLEKHFAIPSAGEDSSTRVHLGVRPSGDIWTILLAVVRWSLWHKGSD
jgi:hypothetical protein